MPVSRLACLAAPLLFVLAPAPACAIGLRAGGGPGVGHNATIGARCGLETVVSDQSIFV